jgi:hypothetical protein
MGGEIKVLWLEIDIGLMPKISFRLELVTVST